MNLLVNGDVIYEQSINSRIRCTCSLSRRNCDQAYLAKLPSEKKKMPLQYTPPQASSSVSLFLIFKGIIRKQEMDKQWAAFFTSLNIDAVRHALSLSTQKHDFQATNLVDKLTARKSIYIEGTAQKYPLSRCCKSIPAVQYVIYVSIKFVKY